MHLLALADGLERVDRPLGRVAGTYPLPRPPVSELVERLCDPGSEQELTHLDAWRVLLDASDVLDDADSGRWRRLALGLLGTAAGRRATDTCLRIAASGHRALISPTWPPAVYAAAPDAQTRELAQLAGVAPPTLIRECFQSGRSPLSVLDDVGVSPRPSYLDTLVTCMVEQLAERGAAGTTEQMASSFEDTLLRHVIHQRLTASLADAILINLGPEDVSKTLSSWLLSRVKRSNTLRQRLSSAARRALARWMGLDLYRTMDGFVELACAGRHAARLGMHQSNNIHKLRERTAFWRGYFGQLEQVRILLPQRTARMLRQEQPELAEGADLVTLEEDGTPEKYKMEVFVMMFETVIVAQELRTSGSGMRVFRRDPTNVKWFFGTAPSLMQIRARPNLFVHDHNKSWQERAAHRLALHGVLPDDGSTPPEPEPPKNLANWEASRRRQEEEARRWLRERRLSRPQTSTSQRSSRSASPYVRVAGRKPTDTDEPW